MAITSYNEGDTVLLPWTVVDVHDLGQIQIIAVDGSRAVISDAAIKSSGIDPTSSLKYATDTVVATPVAGVPGLTVDVPA